MYGSGIPDIVLEMTLMKLAAPVQNFAAPVTPVQTALPSENLDAGRKIFYDVASFLSGKDSTLGYVLNQAVVMNFAGDVLTVGFRGDVMANVFQGYLQKFEQAAERIAGRAIKVSVEVNANLPPPILNGMSEPARSNLADAMQAFQASDAVKIND